MTDPGQESIPQDEETSPYEGSARRLSSIARVLGYLVAWLMGTSVASSFVFPFVSGLRPTELRFMAVVAVPNAVAAVLITLGFVRYVDHRPVCTLGLCREGSWLREVLFGVMAGVALAGMIFVISFVAGWTEVIGSLFMRSPVAVAGVVVQTVVAIVGMAAVEEVAIRGYVLQTLRHGYGRMAALIVSSAFFGLLHLANPGAGMVAFVGTAAAGLLLGYAYLATGRLWLPFGIHFGWNFALGPIFGFPVSGLSIPGWLMQRTAGPALWTGEAFGPEAGLLGLLALVGGVFAVHWFRAHWYLAAKPALQTSAADTDDESREDERAA